MKVGDNLITTLNLNREQTAILENAFDIGYEKQVNSVWTLSQEDPMIFEYINTN